MFFFFSLLNILLRIFYKKKLHHLFVKKGERDSNMKVFSIFLCSFNEERKLHLDQIGFFFFFFFSSNRNFDFQLFLLSCDLSIFFFLQVRQTYQVEKQSMPQSSYIYQAKLCVLDEQKLLSSKVPYSMSNFGSE